MSKKFDVEHNRSPSLSINDGNGLKFSTSPNFARTPLQRQNSLPRWSDKIPAYKSKHGRTLSSGSRLPLFLPHWARSVKGLLVLMVVLVITTTSLTVHFASNSAVRRARTEAQAAELLLSDPQEYRRRYGASSRTTALLGNLKKTSLKVKEHLRRYKPQQDARDALAALSPVVAAPAKPVLDRNGLMMAKEGSRHPMLTLIEKGKQDWEALNAKQSKTLDEAVQEYRRRYKKNPPKGFKQWWTFAQENDVQLPDEYDFVHRDIELFASLEPADLIHRNKVMQDREHTFTLHIQSGKVSITGPFAHIRRAKDIADLISRFSETLPHDMSMTFIMDDQPAVMLEHERKTRMLEVAAQGEYFGPSDYVEEDNAHLTNYARACPSNSPLRRAEEGENNPELERQAGLKSFIWNSEKANDICAHPEFRQLHGHTVVTGTGLTPIVPLFAFAKMPTHSDMLATPLEQYSDSYIGYDPPWESKPNNRLLWRGSMTGSDFIVDKPWRLSQRARIHFMAKENEGHREVMWTGADEVAQVSNFTTESLNQLYLDTKFSGVPAQCDEVTCKLMDSEMSRLVGLDESLQYKYLLDVDGNAWSGRFHRLMSSNSLVLKSTVFPEWYAQRLIPYYHYVPIKVDYTDLYDVMSFFVGTPTGAGSHDHLAKEIAANGKEFTKSQWRRADMASYMMRLCLEYSRLLHPGDSDGDFLEG